MYLANDAVKGMLSKNVTQDPLDRPVPTQECRPPRGAAVGAGAWRSPCALTEEGLDSLARISELIRTVPTADRLMDIPPQYQQCAFITTSCFSTIT